MLKDIMKENKIDAIKKDKAVKELILDKLELDIENGGILLWDKRRFDNSDYKKYWFQKDFLKDPANKTVVMSASQMGKTLQHLKKATYRLDKFGSPVGYYHPDFQTLSSIVKSDFDIAIKEKMIEKGFWSRNLITTDTQREKIINGTKIRFLSTGNANNAHSFKLQVLLVDEYDRVKEDFVKEAISRLSSYPVEQRYIMFFSTPTFTDFGIHKEYINSSQGSIYITCAYCYEKQELTIEDNVKCEVDKEKKQVKNSYIHCKKCGKKMHPNDPKHKKEWIHKYPERKVRGYYWNGLFNPNLDLDGIMTAYYFGTEAEKRKMWNQDIGLPYDGASEGKLTIGDLNNIRGNYYKGQQIQEELYMGIDVGFNKLNITFTNFNGDLIDYFDEDDMWKTIPKLNDAFGASDLINYSQILLNKYNNTVMITIDNDPDPNMSKIYVDGMNALGFLARRVKLTGLNKLYVEGNDLNLTFDRTSVIEIILQKIKNKQVEIPKNTSDEFKKQCTNLIKIKKDNKYEYKHDGKDDYLFAWIYSICGIEYFKDNGDDWINEIGYIDLF